MQMFVANRTLGVEETTPWSDSAKTVRDYITSDQSSPEIATTSKEGNAATDSLLIV